MLKIELTNDFAFGENGPNFIWLGKKEDFAKILPVLMPLSESENFKIEFSSKNFSLSGLESILFQSTHEGKTLTKIITKNKLEVILPSKIWVKIIDMFKDVSNIKGTHFIEPNGEFVEDANWIIESS